MKYIVMSLIVAILGGIGIGMTDLSQEVQMILSFMFGVSSGLVGLFLYEAHD